MYHVAPQVIHKPRPNACVFDNTAPCNSALATEAIGIVCQYLAKHGKSRNLVLWDPMAGTGTIPAAAVRYYGNLFRLILASDENPHCKEAILDNLRLTESQHMPDIRVTDDNVLKKLPDMALRQRVDAIVMDPPMGRSCKLVEANGEKIAKDADHAARVRDIVSACMPALAQDGVIAIMWDHRQILADHLGAIPGIEVVRWHQDCEHPLYLAKGKLMPHRYLTMIQKERKSYSSSRKFAGKRC